MNEAIERLIPLYGDTALETLKRKTVLVVGIGGVGSFAAEALARMQVGNLILIDGDTVQKSNLNRQLIALHSTIGQAKVDVMKARILDINPLAHVKTHHMRYNETVAETIFHESIDGVIDAIDSLKDKADLIARCHQTGIPFISAMGQGNRTNTDQVVVTDLFKTSGDPLARKLRKLLRVRGIEQAVPVVFNRAEPLRRQRPAFVASTPFGPPMAGLKAAQNIIHRLLKEVSS